MSAPAQGPVAILAGAGRLPLELARDLKDAGRDFRILAFRGFALADVRKEADAICNVLDPATVLSTLEAWSPSAVTLVGGIRRPGLQALLGAYSVMRNMREVREVIARGDDHVLRGAVSLLEEHGFTVVGAHELSPRLAVPAGFVGGAPVTEAQRAAISTAMGVLEALAPHDVGQAVVVAERRILAIEGPEGTDRMLRRVRRLRRSWFRRREGGVLVKAAKRAQDLRVDMPAIGPRTVVEAARGGLSGIAVGALSTLLLDREATVQAAERLGLFIVSVELPWMRAAA